MEQKIQFINNKRISANLSSYTEVQVNTDKIIRSWKDSLFSFEWLLPDGRIRDLEELPFKEQAKRERIENALKSGDKIEKPVLGIGLLENIEIGMGKAEMLTLSAHGYKIIPVHIPKSNESDFQSFLSDVS